MTLHKFVSLPGHIFDHADDCGGTVCKSCGCCIHCADDCPCPGCSDTYCGCGSL